MMKWTESPNEFYFLFPYPLKISLSFCVPKIFHYFACYDAFHYYSIPAKGRACEFSQMAGKKDDGLDLQCKSVHESDISSVC